MCKVNGESYSKVIKTDKYQDAINSLLLHINTYVMPTNKMTYAEKYAPLKELAQKKYEDLDTFKKAINDAIKECYEYQFVPINWNLILQKEEEGELFLFKINCKDYEKGCVGKKDLQTIYWEDVLTENSMHQLNANGEIFMRKSLDTRPFAYKVGEKLVNKKDTQGHSIPDNIYNEIFLFSNKEKKESELSKDALQYLKNELVTIKDVKHEIIKDERFYNETKYFFSLPYKGKL